MKQCLLEVSQQHKLFKKANICSVSQDTCFQNPSESSDWFRLVHSVEYDQIFPLKSTNVGKKLVSGCPLVFSFKGWYINLYSGTAKFWLRLQFFIKEESWTAIFKILVRSLTQSDQSLRCRLNG